ncbi:alpha/beta hydrolase fold domain-containing protein [Streptomyces sp. NPDC051771]|uniref:alpha/beta hydrolase n=1 Tax=Streptomyces sp. NPDC051771 TaxID=3154847 RepID=UPI0034210508
MCTTGGAGNRFSGGLIQVLPWVVAHDAFLVTVDYRLAPEFPDLYPVEDRYAGLMRTAEHARGLGMDPDRLIIAGQSAGGGLAAGAALLARDR